MPPLHSLGVPFFFFNDTATTEIYTLSLHDALPISSSLLPGSRLLLLHWMRFRRQWRRRDRKSTRLNSSHQIISYAVFCLKKKKDNPHRRPRETWNPCRGVYCTCSASITYCHTEHRC